MMTAKKLELIGHATVLICKSTFNTKRATVAVMITTDGNILPGVLIFKGKPNGRIQHTEFEMFPGGHFYCCQENAWMDKVVMLFLVNAILKPYVSMSPDHVIPLLILDSY